MRTFGSVLRAGSEPPRLRGNPRGGRATLRGCRALWSALLTPAELFPGWRVGLAPGLLPSEFGSDFGHLEFRNTPNSLGSHSRGSFFLFFCTMVCGRIADPRSEHLFWYMVFCAIGCAGTSLIRVLSRHVFQRRSICSWTVCCVISRCSVFFVFGSAALVPEFAHVNDEA